MRPDPSWLSKVATIYSGHDWRKEDGPMARGRVIAYIEGPSVMVEDENGHRSTWPTSLPIDLSDEHIHRWLRITNLGEAADTEICTLPGCIARREVPL